MVHTIGAGQNRFEEERLSKIARSLGLELVRFPVRRGRLAGHAAYKLVDLQAQEVVYGEQDDLDLRYLWWFLEATASVELPRLKKEQREKARARKEQTRLREWYAKRASRHQ